MEPLPGSKGTSGNVVLRFGELLQPVQQQVQLDIRPGGPPEPDFILNFLGEELERKVQSFREHAAQPELEGQFLLLHVA